MKNWLLSFLLIVLITSCKENEEDTTSLDVSNINLIDVGHGTSGFDFEAHSVGDSSRHLQRKTPHIRDPAARQGPQRYSVRAQASRT